MAIFYILGRKGSFTMTTQTLSAVELLRRHHEYAMRWENNVATDEQHWVNGGDALHLCRKWYVESDLCKQTAEVLAANNGEAVSK